MRFFLIFGLALGLLSSCNDSSSSPGVAPAQTAEGGPFTLSGKVTYDYIPTQYSPSIKLNYSGKTQRPIRRAVVQAIDTAGGVQATTVSDDNGDYTLNVPAYIVTLRIVAKSVAVGNTTDAYAPNNCNGASWDVRIVDNVTYNPASASNGALRGVFAYDDTTKRFATATVNLNANTEFSSGYTYRAGAPFALLDTLISEIETVCKAQANVTLPLLYVNWNPINITYSPVATYMGRLGGTYYTTESGVSNIYVLGKENVDTDEYDAHIVAHEFGHFLENKLFRADSVGGPHQNGDSLDGRVAFSEGYGYAMAGMTFNDPVSVDTNGSNQALGFTIDVSVAPTGDNRGYYSERSCQYLLWSLYENRDGTANSGNFDRIFNIFLNYQKTTPAFTSVTSFAAYYNQVYGGAAESLQTLWGTTLDTPYDALCSGSCAGTGDTADLYDVDGDIGTYYNAQGRKYQQSTGSAQTAAFWNLYRTISSGTNASNGHEKTIATAYPTSPINRNVNKLGVYRWFRYVANATTSVTISVSGGTANCGADYLDMFAYASGSLLAYDIATTGCPTVTFNATNGTTYMIAIQALTNGTNSYDIIVSP